jgi:hypothetical protein
MLKAAAIADGALAARRWSPRRERPPRSLQVSAATRTGQSRCIASYSPPAGCTAAAWHCCSARSGWLGFAPGPCPGR